MASWAADDGSIDTSAPRRPGIVNSNIVHSVKLNGEYYQHAFAVVWWYKTDPTKGPCWQTCPDLETCDYEHCGPALFMLVQCIAQKFACCSVKVNGLDKLVVNPIPRSFH